MLDDTTLRRLEEPAVAAALEAINQRLRWASLHWGSIDPDACAHLAIVAADAALASSEAAR